MTNLLSLPAVEFDPNPKWTGSPTDEDKAFGYLVATVEESVIFELKAIFGRPEAELLAYARLFAAAPVLYQTLTSAEKNVRGSPSFWSKRTWALAAAKGETPKRTGGSRYE